MIRQSRLFMFADCRSTPGLHFAFRPAAIGCRYEFRCSALRRSSRTTVAAEVALLHPFETPMPRHPHQPNSGPHFAAARSLTEPRAKPAKNIRPAKHLRDEGCVGAPLLRVATLPGAAIRGCSDALHGSSNR